MRHVYHFRNLSRGLLCPCSTPKCHIIRLQSTACEQHRWSPILHELGAELFYALALGHVCVIHDLSERDLETRACWQGLSWIRYACYRSWTGHPPLKKELGRGIMNLNPYWEVQFRALPDTTRSLLSYYAQFYSGGDVNLTSCWTRQQRDKKHESR